VPKGVSWTELKVAKVLQEYRDQQNYSKGASFETIGRKYLKHFGFQLFNQ
jgi:hypothetical protein